MRRKLNDISDGFLLLLWAALVAVLVLGASRCASPASVRRAETNRACADMNRDVAGMVSFREDGLARPEGVLKLLIFSRDQSLCIKAQNADLMAVHDRLTCSRRQLDEIRRSPLPGSVFQFTERCK